MIKKRYCYAVIVFVSIQTRAWIEAGLRATSLRSAALKLKEACRAFGRVEAAQDAYNTQINPHNPHNGWDSAIVVVGSVDVSGSSSVDLLLDAVVDGL